MSSFGAYQVAWVCTLIASVGLLCSAAVATTVSDLEQAVVVPRDPTQPPGAPSRKANSARAETKSEKRKPILTSILLSDDRRLAIINDKLVREGERVAGMTLVRVGKDEVQLQGANQARLLVLRLPKSNIGKDYR